MQMYKVKITTDKQEMTFMCVAENGFNELSALLLERYPELKDRKDIYVLAVPVENGEQIGGPPLRERGLSMVEDLGIENTWSHVPELVQKCRDWYGHTAEEHLGNGEIQTTCRKCGYTYQTFTN